MPDCEQTYHDPKHKGILKHSTRVLHIILSGLAGPHSGLFGETLERYFSSLNLSPEDIDLPLNAITIDRSLQYQLRTDLVSLEAIEEHSHRIRDHDPSIVSSRYLSGSGKVSFVNHDSRYELPSPVLLEIHAVIARILHITRKDREIDGLMEKSNKTGTLAEDGSTDVEALLVISGFKTRTSGYSHADE